MIKSVSMRNFEAHEDTTVEFEENMNLIVGMSNAGKSAIIRALGVVVNNDWCKEMVRAGCDFCTVRVTTQRGWVECERGDKVNRWKCQEEGGEVQSYRNVGIRVPDLATRILGMGERDRGSGIRELPNFQFQLERHYMLSEIGEKKATSNMIAVMMDNAIGLGGMEELIKAVSADLLRDRRWVTEKQSEVSEVRSGILDESIFGSYSELVDAISAGGRELSAMAGDIRRAEAHLDGWSRLRGRLGEAESRLSSMAGVESMAEEVCGAGAIGSRIAVAEEALRLRRRLASLDGILSVDAEGLSALSADCGRSRGLVSLCESLAAKEEAVLRHAGAISVDPRVIDGAVDDCVSSGLSLRLCESCVAKESALLSARRVLSADVDALSGLCAEAESLGRRVAEAERLLRSARESWKSQASAERDSSRLAKELSAAESELDELKSRLGVCPLCGRRLS